MDIPSLVEKSLELSFELMSSMVLKGTLTKNSGKSFNFQSKSVVSTETASIPVSVIKIGQEHNSRDGKRRQGFLLQRKQTGDIAILDILTLNSGEVWKITSPMENDRFTMTVTANKEM